MKSPEVYRKFANTLTAAGANLLQASTCEHTNFTSDERLELEYAASQNFDAARIFENYAIEAELQTISNFE